MAVSSSDRTALGIILTLYIVGMMYLFRLFCWPFGKKKGGGHRAHRNKTIISRRGDNHKILSRRVHSEFGKAKALAHQNRQQQLHADVAFSSPDRSTIAAKYLVLTLCLEERLAGIIQETADDLEVSKQAIAGLEGIVSTLIATADDIQRGCTESQPRSVTQDLLAQLDSMLRVIGPVAVTRGEYGLDSAEMVALETRLRRHIRFRDLDWKILNTSAAVDDDEYDANHKSLYERVTTERFRQHCWFYLLFWGTYVGILLSHFAHIGTGTIRGKTFLNLPPQYNLDVQIQSVMVPMIYGIMHTALFALGLLPLGMTRGLWRDLAIAFPGIRSWIPVDDMSYFHKLNGVLAIGGIVIGATLWLIAMGPSCFQPGVAKGVAQEQACSAMNPTIVDAKKGGQLLFDSFAGASYADPRDNVLFLRLLVWLLWPFGMPLIHFVHRKMPGYFPTFVKTNFFEIAWIIHYYGGIVTIVLALYARFEVFYPMLISWGIWALDRWRDVIFNTFHTEIVVCKDPTETTLCHLDDSDGKPTILNVRIKKPRSFTSVAGQIMYLKVPDIDPFWHAFSLASSSADEEIHLHIGLIGNDWKKNRSGQWKQPKASATWTYKLLEQWRLSVQELASNFQTKTAPIACKIRGPYGSPFTKCFNPKYKGVIVIGAGTGLTSALSVLKEKVVQRLRRPDDADQYVWFVWTCRRVEDLLWAWRTLEATIYQAIREGAIDPLSDPDWSPYTSTMLDWLSITIYVTKADHTKLVQFLDGASPEEMDVALESSLQAANRKLSRKTSSIRVSSVDGPLPPLPRMSVTSIPEEAALDTAARTIGTRAPMPPPDDFADSHLRRSATIKARREQDALPPSIRRDRKPGGRSRRRQSYQLEAVELDGVYSVPSSHPVLPPRAPRQLPTAPTSMARRKTANKHVPTGMENFFASAQTEEIYEAHYGTNRDALGRKMVGEDVVQHQAALANLQAQDVHWLQTGLSRDQAERLLFHTGRRGSIGDFVVRASGKGRGYALSVLIGLRDNGLFEHHLLDNNNPSGNFTIDDHVLNPACKTLEETMTALLSRGHSTLTVTLSMPANADDIIPSGWHELRSAALVVAHKPNSITAQEELLGLLNDKSRDREVHKVNAWLREQVIEASVDHEKASIGNLLLWVNDVLEQRYHGQEYQTAVCFCGPPALAQVISERASEAGSRFEYSSEHQ